MPAVEVPEIHAHPLRPERFEEPLFATVASKRAVMEHFLEASWLMRASELKERAGEAAHALDEPVVLKRYGSQMKLLRPQGRRKCARRREQVVEVLDCWREVGRWWDEDRCVDRMVFRVLLSSGGVIDLARQRSGDWILVGVVD